MDGDKKSYSIFHYQLLTALSDCLTADICQSFYCSTFIVTTVLQLLQIVKNRL